MRGLAAWCAGLAMIIGTMGAADAGLVGGECCICRCFSAPCDDHDEAGAEASELEFAACLQVPDGGGEPSAECDVICGAGQGDVECSFGPMPCQTFSPECATSTRAPAASAYGIAALFVALGGLGAYQLRQSRAVRRSRFT